MEDFLMSAVSKYSTLTKGLAVTANAADKASLAKVANVYNYRTHYRTSGVTGRGSR